MDSAFVELFRSDRSVTSFDTDREHIYFLSGHAVLKVRKNENRVVNELDLFQEDGKSRSLIVDDSFIYYKDLRAPDGDQ